MFSFKQLDEFEEKKLWKEFDKLMEDLKNNSPWSQTRFTTTQNRQTLLPVKSVGNDMKELLDKYNALKLYVTGVENENKRLKIELEDMTKHYSIAVRDIPRQFELKSSLEKVINLLQRIKDSL
jgi:hypothetical protein